MKEEMTDVEYSKYIDDMVVWLNERNINVGDGINLFVSLIAKGIGSLDGTLEADEEFIKEMGEQLRVGIAYYRNKDKKETIQ